MKYTLAIDQSTSATKVMLFDENEELKYSVAAEHKQYYPQPGWVEHDPEEILRNLIAAIRELLFAANKEPGDISSVAITNQRETVVVWDVETGKPIYNAVVWQCQRGKDICDKLKSEGYSELFREKTGLIIDPYFSASGVKWILDNVDDARAMAEAGKLRMGTIDTWLIWNLTKSKCTVHATDYTNASRTLLFNINTLEWDEELLKLFTIPASMMPELRPCDSVFGETDLLGLLPEYVPIAGVMGDSHAALFGQLCFSPGLGKATYGTGSSVMFNIGLEPVLPPDGLVTSVGFAACGDVHYALEGNIHCTGDTIKWMVDNLELIENSKISEAFANNVSDNGGVYFVPAFAGLGAPWWNNEARAIICGMSRGSTKSHIVRAALEAIAYQVKDLVDTMTGNAGVLLKELRVDGGPVSNEFLMKFQADILNAPVNRSAVKESSAFGVVLMNALALGRKKNLESIQTSYRKKDIIYPDMTEGKRVSLYEGWKKAVQRSTI